MAATGSLADPQPITDCAQGHDYTPENTYTDGAGKRHCKICRKAASTKARKAKVWPTCSIETCTQTTKGGAKTWCAAHYRKFSLYGDPLGSAPPREIKPCKHPGGCRCPASRDGWCDAHYRRVRKTGDPGPAEIRQRITDWETGFWSRVDKQGPDECWPWTGLTTEGGYGIHWPEGANGKDKTGVQRTTAHRIAYELLVGPIPDELTLDHVADRCSRRDCCNPAHLEPVTRGENNLRGNSPAAQNARKKGCGNGHEYTPANTYVGSNGKRKCRICVHDRYLSMLGVDRDAIIAEHGMVCHLCGEPIESLDDLHIDHVIPVNSGGAELGLENLLPAHGLCNLRKGATLPLL